ncbi:MAG: hypothetical protein A4E69_02114 [Syntrophus sp. PtaB.Bin138]|uniref:hypothetical protein n=1 Tax=Syntrophus sp. (in: bacteria) TaxID=48412 RepID=UPI0009CCD0C4|nr:MAG: hypothetical protein A4E69_02114 [Syntrophus sp. PtaB.Bin138]
MRGIPLAVDRGILERVEFIRLDYVDAGGLSGFLLISGRLKEGGDDISYDFISTISSHPIGG